MPELVRARDLEVARPPAPRPRERAGCSSRVLAHQPLAALAVDRPPELAGGDRGDHPRAVGRRVVARATASTTRSTLVQRPALPARRAPRAPVDRLAADPRDARDHARRGGLARPVRGTGRRARSLPAPQEFPRDLHLHRLAPQRPLELGDLAAQLVGLGALRLALQALGAGGEELLAPLAQQAVGDVVLAAELRDRLRAAQRREHDLGLLLRA